MARVLLVFRSKTDTLRVPITETLFKTVRENARRNGVPYRRYIRQLIESAVKKPLKLKRTKAKAG